MPAREVLRILLVGIVCQAALITPAWADETQKPILKGAYTEFPPLTYTDSQGQPAGAYLDYASRLASRAGYDIEWRSLPIDRIYLYLKEGRLDLWLGSKGVPAISAWTQEPDFSLRPIRLNAYHLEETEPVDGVSDLHGEELIIIRGYTYLDHLDQWLATNDPRIGQASTHRAALRMLEAGRGDYLLDFKAPVADALETLTIPNLTHSPITSWGTTLVFSARIPNTESLIRDFEQAQRRLDPPLRR